jgi:hypothetical protein
LAAWPDYLFPVRCTHLLVLVYIRSSFLSTYCSHTVNISYGFGRHCQAHCHSSCIKARTAKTDAISALFWLSFLHTSALFTVICIIILWLLTSICLDFYHINLCGCYSFLHRLLSISLYVDLYRYSDFCWLAFNILSPVLTLPHFSFVLALISIFHFGMLTCIDTVNPYSDVSQYFCQRTRFLSIF